MLSSRHLPCRRRRHSLKTLSSLLLQPNPSRYIPPLSLLQSDSDFSTKCTSRSSISISSEGVPLVSRGLGNCFGGCGWREMSMSMSTSTGGGRSMREKVESRMRLESFRNKRELLRAFIIEKKLMTDEERLLYSLRRARRKVALLLENLKKYELPELPPSRHDPELLTQEQLQAFKKIGFKNKNYCQVGVRGVFGGVVLNMNLHWKFHETVQVICDKYPKEKIREVATILARLSGGIVVNIHNVKTLIFYRGRNYRQPKRMIPLNTLTKRKALFRARFEQALESQKLHIENIKHQLQGMGINPDDPVSATTTRRVASTFFAINKDEGSSYDFHGDKKLLSEPNNSLKPSKSSVDSDEEELDRFISEIEDAADKEFAAEEAAEKESFGKIQYWNKEDLDRRFRRNEMPRNEDSDGDRRHWDTRSRQRAADDEEDFSGRFRRSEMRGNSVEDIGDRRHWKDTRGRQRAANNGEDFSGRFRRYEMPRDSVEDIGDRRHWKDTRGQRAANNGDDFSRRFRRSEMLRNEDSVEDIGDRRHWKDTQGRQRVTDSDEDDGISEGENEWDAVDVGDAIDLESDIDDSDNTRDDFKVSGRGWRQSDDNDRSSDYKSFRATAEAKFRGEIEKEDSGSEDLLSDLENEMWRSDSEEVCDPKASRRALYDYRNSSDEVEKCNPMKRVVNSNTAFVSDVDGSDEISDSMLSKINWKEDRIGRVANDNDGLKSKTETNFGRNMSVSKDVSSDHEIASGESDAEEDSDAYRAACFDHGSNDEEENVYMKRNEYDTNYKMPKTDKQVDEDWDSD